MLFSKLVMQRTKIPLVRSYINLRGEIWQDEWMFPNRSSSFIEKISLPSSLSVEDYLFKWSLRLRFIWKWNCDCSWGCSKSASNMSDYPGITYVHIGRHLFTCAHWHFGKCKTTRTLLTIGCLCEVSTWFQDLLFVYTANVMKWPAWIT